MSNFRQTQIEYKEGGREYIRRQVAITSHEDHSLKSPIEPNTKETQNPALTATGKKSHSNSFFFKSRVALALLFGWA